MKKWLLFPIFIIVMISAIRAQSGKISGTLQDTTSGAVVIGARVTVNAIEKVTDEKGYFEFTDVPFGNWVIVIEHEGHERISIPALLDAAHPSFDAGTIKVKQASSIDVDNSEATVSAQDLEDENKLQNISGPLHSANDVFVSGVSYTLGAGGFRIRGFDSDNSIVCINGAVVNNAENGRAMWSEWGGLNDAFRQKTTSSGFVPSDFTFGDVGGATNINTRPSVQRKQIKISYATSNKTYTNSISATYSTGLMDNGWAFMVNASRRFGNGGYIEGTFYDGWSYYMAVERKLNNKHSLSITAFAAPIKRGMQGSAIQEANDLSYTNYYNPNWGMQDGKVRNARVRNVNEPHIMLNHYWTVNPLFKVNTALSYTFGRNGNTAINWYNSADPRPDYYRNLPSYQLDGQLAADYAIQWKNDVNVRQINWDKLYQINYLANGAGKQARYIVEERRNDYQQFDYTTTANYEISKNIKITGGIEYKTFTGHHFKTLDDLLGGDYWVDINNFAERDFKSDTIKQQNDLNNPNKVIYEGDVFGYDYLSHINSENIWVQAEVTNTHLDYFLAATATNTQFWRHGNMKNGEYPNNSFGDSEKQKFFNYGVKGGATYKITGRHFIMASAGYLTQAPLFKNAYMSPRIRADIIPGLKSEELFSAELSYIVRYPRISGRISAYQTMFKNQSEIRSYYFDLYSTFVNQAMTGINKTHQGVEAGVEVKATKTIAVTGIFALGSYFYTSRPTATIAYDNGAKPDTTETIYMKNYYISGTPQSAASLSVKYSSPKYWFASVSANYFDIVYISIDPERRTTTALDGLDPNDPLIPSILAQESTKKQFTLDASLGKSWKIKDYFINANFNINNVLNNTTMRTNGYEQSRFDFTTKQISSFPPKYFYGFGRTYYLSVSFRF